MTAGPPPDVLVVGLGPAGAAVALAAASAGCRVWAVERNRSPGEPVQCAEFVPNPIFDEAPQTRGASVQPIGRMQTYLEGAAAEVTANFRGQMIDRAEFDRALIARAQAAGAACRFGLPLRSLTADGAFLADGTAVRPRAIIGADGPLSVVGRALGLVNVALVDSRQITVDLLQPHDATDIFLRRSFPGGYGWLFPKGERCNLGLGLAQAHRRALKPELDALHAELVAAGRVGAAVHRTTGGLIPVGGIVGPQGRLGQALVLLAGDAAGLTHPVTGAGIAAAVVSGRMAGLAAAAWAGGDQTAGEDYAEELRDIYGTTLDHALRRRAAILSSDLGPQAQRAGWIAYPEYWARKPQTDAYPPSLETIA